MNVSTYRPIRLDGAGGWLCARATACQLNNPSALVRKRAIAAFGSLSAAVSDALYARLAAELAALLESRAAGGDLRTAVQVLCPYSRSLNH